MPLVHLLIGLTIVVVLGYFVLLSSERADGRMKTFGRTLAIWLFVLPVLALIAAAAHGSRNGGWRGLRQGPAPQLRRPPQSTPAPPGTAAAPAAPEAGPPPPAR